jgi:putative addiction module killer protein
LEYLDEQDSTPFRRWFNRLNREAAAEVSCALVRLELGYRSKLRAVGAGVIEYRINFGPGYRIYFGRDGDQLIILLGGGLARGWFEETPGRRYFAGKSALERLQTSQTTKRFNMALTRAFKETIKARVERDPGFRKALLARAAQAMLAGRQDAGEPDAHAQRNRQSPHQQPDGDF